MSRTIPWIESSITSPAERPEDWVTVPIRFGDREILLARPRDPDRLLDDPAVQRASRENAYMPYWAFLWPGARLLAEYILSQVWPPGTRAAEIGCGLGLAGLAALATGMHVTFTDYSPAALALATHNARLNRFDQFATRIVDWQDPPREPFDLLLGADDLYEPRCLGDVLRVLDAMLARAGVALLSDPDRAVADAFPEQARARGYAVNCTAVESVAEDRRVIRGRIFRVTRPCTF